MTDRNKQFKALGRGAIVYAFSALLMAMALLCAQAQTTHHAAASKSSAHSVPPLPVVGLPMKSAAPPVGTNQLVVYGGQSPDDAGITVAAWGGGAVETTADQAYMQGHSLKIVTKGPYQGGQIVFANPVALGNLSEEKSRYLQLVIQATPAPGNEEFPSDNQVSDAGPAAYWGQARAGAPQFRLVQGGPPQGMPGFPGGGMPPGYRPGGGYGPPMGYGPPPGAMPGQQPAQGQEDQESGLPIKQLHLILQLADGSQADVMRPVPQTDTGWIRVALPLSILSFPASSAGNARLKSLVVAGDLPATVYVGEIRLIDDNTPITAIPPDEQDVAANDEVTFQGNGDGGASSLKYTWDFDTKGSFVPDAEGQNVTHHYTKSGDYKVTLMVSDLDGIKKPATVTTTVHVEE